MTSLRDPEGQPQPEGLMAISNVGLQEITEHPFGKGDLTSDGIQYSDPVTSGTAESTYATVAVATASPPQIAGQLYELEFGLTAAVRMDATAAATVTWKWQGRSIDVARGTVVSTRDWRDLHSEDSSAFAAEATAYVEDTKSGRLNLDKDLDRFPIELQLLVHSSKVSDGVAKVKNASYVRAVTSTLYRRALD